MCGEITVVLLTVPVLDVPGCPWILLDLTGCEYKIFDVLVLGNNHSVRQFTICPAGFHIQLCFKLVGQCFTLKREQEGPIFLTTKLKH